MVETCGGFYGQKAKSKSKRWHKIKDGGLQHISASWIFGARKFLLDASRLFLDASRVSSTQQNSFSTRRESCPGQKFQQCKFPVLPLPLPNYKYPSFLHSSYPIFRISLVPSSLLLSFSSP